MLPGPLSFAYGLIVAILTSKWRRQERREEENDSRPANSEEGDMMGRPFVGALVVSLCLGLLAVLGLLLGSPPQAGRASQVTTALGIDANPTGNSATSLGQIDVCVSVGAGESFDVDIFVTDVANLVGWQTIFTYDPSVLKVANADMELFMAGSEPGRTLNLSDVTPDQDGSYSIIVVDTSPDSSGHSGSGVLTRITLEAVGTGMSFLTLGDTILADPTAQIIGSVNGDELFDGALGYAQVWVGEPCPGTLPSPTPGPATPSPVATAAATSAATSATPAKSPPATSSTPPPQATATPSEGGDNGGFPWVVVIGAVAATIVAALAAALVFRWLLRRAA